MNNLPAQTSPHTASLRETTRASFDQYLGIPFLPKGTTRAGLDCYGLARLFYREQYGVEIPDYSAGYSEEIRGGPVAETIEGALVSTSWIQVSIPRRGDLALFRLYGIPFHVGIVIDSGSFLHVATGITSCIERLSSPLWRHRLKGFYGYADQD